MTLNYSQVMERVNMIRYLWLDHIDSRSRIRQIIDGGPEGMRALLGNRLNVNKVTDLPAVNMFETGVNRLSQDLGRPPDVKTDPLPTSRGLTAEDQRKRADKRRRIVLSYDYRRMARQLRQQSLWLPGYGYCLWVLTERDDGLGNKYPTAEIRDPYNSYPSWWSPDEDPDELVTIRRVPARTLARLYPKHKSAILEAAGVPGGTDGSMVTSWIKEQPGLEIVEYQSFEASYYVSEDLARILDVVENPLTTGPRFKVGRRATFNKLIGQYDNAIGLLAHMAKLNILALIATEDSVFRETNVSGGLESVEYQRGRFAVNYLPPGATVDRPTGDFPVSAFEQINRLERQLRTQTQYPVDQDGISPLSFATGEGIDRLTATTDRMVAQYRDVLAETLEAVDMARLEWDEKMYPEASKPMHGIEQGDMFFEEYTPSRDIRKEWQSRRVFGPMAGIDEPTKIVAGLQLLQAGVIDNATFREMLHGLGNLDRIRDHVRRDRAERAMFDILEQRAINNDPEATLILTRVFENPDEAGQEMAKFFTPEEPEVDAEAQAMLAAQQPALGPGAPPDVQTVLSQLSQGGNVGQGGVQTVGRL